MRQHEHSETNMDKIKKLTLIIKELNNEDELTLVDLLDIRAEQLIDRFLDVVEERMDILARYYDIDNPDHEEDDSDD